MIVVDASVAAAIVLPDEPELSPRLQAAIYAGPAVAPAHWPTEVGNAIFQAIRRRRIEEADRPKIIRQSRQLMVLIEPMSPDHIWSDVIDLAGKHGLTLYDAAYLDLAIHRSASLASNDRDLVDAARACDVEVYTDLP